MSTDQSRVTHGTFFYLAHEERLMSNTSVHAGIRCKLAVCCFCTVFFCTTDVAFELQGTSDIETDQVTGFQLISTDDIDDIGVTEIIHRIRDRVGTSPVYLR